jgi:hypothetical protein
MVFLHATSRAAKMWPEANWRALIGAFARAGFAMLLPWGNADERARSERLAAGEAAARIPPRQQLDALAGVIARAELVIGVDTGLVHLAAALGTPTVSLFVATDAKLAGVERARRSRAIWEASGGSHRSTMFWMPRARCCDARRKAEPPPMRALYTLLGYLILPFAPLRLWWRGRREPGYREHIGERFGRYRNSDSARRGPVLWVHAVSLGETRAAVPLVDRLHRAYPARRCSSRYDGDRACGGARAVRRSRGAGVASL